MKKTYVYKAFGAPALDLIDTINGILDDYEAAGYDLSLRQLYYQLVSRNIVPNTEKSYKNIGVLVSDARLAGLIDWNMIKDRGRELITNPHWDSPKDLVYACADQFRVDMWDNQPNYVEVMVEKQALEGVLLPVCEKYDVPFTANKGYSSSSALYEAGNRVRRAYDKGQEVVVIYLGDHDPSGIDMSRDILDRLKMFSRSQLTVQRIALNMDQVEELQPPENPAKLTDSRAKEYIRRFGHSSWELDAIEPTRLDALVSHAITDLIDPSLWGIRKREQEDGRAKLLTMADSLA